MSFTLVAGSVIRALRVLIGDVNEAGHLVHDEELTILLAGGTDDAAVRAAAIPALDLMIAAASVRVTSESGDESAQWSRLAEQLRKRRTDLLAQGYDDGVASATSGVQTYTRATATVTGDRDWRW